MKIKDLFLRHIRLPGIGPMCPRHLQPFLFNTIRVTSQKSNKWKDISWLHENHIKTKKQKIIVIKPLVFKIPRSSPFSIQKNTTFINLLSIKTVNFGHHFIFASFKKTCSLKKDLSFFSTVRFFFNNSTFRLQSLSNPEPRAHQVSRFPYRLRMQQRCEFRVHENFRQKLNRSQGALCGREMEWKWLVN